MNTSPSLSLRSLRFWINTGFILVLACSVFTRVSVGAPEWSTGKGLQQSLVELNGVTNGIGSEPPESTLVTPASMPVPGMPVPAVLGTSSPLQFSAMVHQLRDRLMHAPPRSL